jgi:hypothetical protein
MTNSSHRALGICFAYLQLQEGSPAMTNLVRQMSGSLNLNDLLLIVSIAVFVPLRLALPLAVQIVLAKRINNV